MLRCIIMWIVALAAVAPVIAGGQRPIIVTGPPVPPSKSGDVPLRREISELHAEGGAQWDLYIQSLQAMKDKAHSDPLSYFQISGIHGKPFVEWNGAGERMTDEWQGYCPHGEKLFLPWHRAFISLFEQTLVENAKRIAQEYPKRYRYQYITAAETLRSPYWDWAADPDVPQVTVPAAVRVKMPRGQHLEAVEVANPLLTFVFPSEVFEGGVYGDFDAQNRTRTYKCPAPEQYPESANEAMAKRPYKRWVYDAFTHADNFTEFASTGDGGLSLEQIHNGVHWDAGCGGQFLAPDFSGFDPLFMLHHTNADRLWAYWQATRPDHASFGRAYRGGARFSTPRATVIGPDSPLEPFFKAEGKFHSSRSVENITSFGYSYQSLEYWDKSDEQIGADARRLVNRLYGPSDRSESRSTARYFARVQVEASEVEKPCTMDFYVGGAYAGSLFVLDHPSRGPVHGELPLEDVLDAVGMQRLSASDTLRSIVSSLEIFIIKADGKLFPLASVPSIRIELEHMLVEPARTDDEFPTYGNGNRTAVLLTDRDLLDSPRK